jgi:hypothetical protein
MVIGQTTLIVVSGVLNLIKESVEPFIEIVETAGLGGYGVQVINLRNFFSTSKKLSDKEISFYKKNFEL